jgi:carboxyl-terminal processing protease
MLTAQNKGAGQNIGFPDVCLTPPVPVPIPYPNIAYNSMSVQFCPTILLSQIPAHNKGTIIPVTFGDCPGSANSPYMDKGEHVQGNAKVYLMGLQGINLTNPTTGNAKNNGIGMVAVPSATNVFYTYALTGGAPPDPPPQPGVMTREALAELGRSLSTSRGPAVESALLPGGVGRITIRRFSSDVPSAVYHAVRQLVGQGMEALVLDLRGNPGGEMNAFVQLAGDFLEPGSIIATMTDADGDDTVYRAQQPLPYRFPVTLLVDAGTASAAELFAGCLQAHGRATVVGERTYGKGEAQTVVISPDGSALYATVASFTLPDGQRVQGVGVTPDLPAASQ